MEDKSKQADFLDMSNISVKYDTVEVGQTYPIYGMITSFIDDDPSAFKIIVNHNIEMTVVVSDPEKVSLLKSRSFDPGIFMCTISQVEPSVKGDCYTIVFGKQTASSEVH